MPPTLRTRRRIVALFLGVLAISLALVARVGYVSLVSGPSLAKSGQEARLRAVPIQPPRGEIVDDRGRVLAGSRATENIYAIPGQVSQPGKEAALLAPVLEMKPQALLKLLGRRQSLVWLKRRATPGMVSSVKRLGLKGVGVIAGSRRLYPYGSLAAAVLGYTGIDDQGLDGLETVYDRELRGKPGAVRIELDAVNRPIPGKAATYVEPTQGDILKLTLDVGVEKLATAAAEQALAETQAKGVGVIVMNVHTGGIVALASTPGFNPNSYGDFAASARRDWLVSDTFPPGSTFKIVTASAALASGVVTLNSGFYDPGFTVVTGRRIRCWKAGGHGSVSFVKVVHGSCNVGFVDMGLRLGTDRFYQYLEKFHLMAPTGIDLPGEARGLIPPKGAVKPLDLATMAFGQTLSLTPVQLLAAVGAVADGGVWHRPHLMEAILSPSGKVLRRYPVKGQRVLSASVARELSGVLGGVVAEGTGKKGQVVGYQMAGKTGTAQAVINGSYVQGQYVSSFVGFGPLPDPTYAALVVINQPVGTYYGGQIAAPVFSSLMGQILALEDAPPDPTLTDEVPIPDVIGQSLDASLAALRRSGLRGRVIGGGAKAMGQFPVSGTPIAKGSEVLVFGTTAGRVQVPDLVGKDLTYALAALDRAGLTADVTGVGKVESQSPAAGTTVSSGTVVHITARPSTPPEGAS